MNLNNAPTASTKPARKMAEYSKHSQSHLQFSEDGLLPANKRDEISPDDMLGTHRNLGMFTQQPRSRIGTSSAHQWFPFPGKEQQLQDNQAQQQAFDEIPTRRLVNNIYQPEESAAPRQEGQGQGQGDRYGFSGEDLVYDEDGNLVGGRNLGAQRPGSATPPVYFDSYMSRQGYNVDDMNAQDSLHQVQRKRMNPMHKMVKAAPWEQESTIPTTSVRIVPKAVRQKPFY